MRIWFRSTSSLAFCFCCSRALSSALEGRSLSLSRVRRLEREEVVATEAVSEVSYCWAVVVLVLVEARWWLVVVCGWLGLGSMVMDILWWEDILVVGLVLLFTVVVLLGVDSGLGKVVNGQLVVRRVLIALIVWLS